MTSPTAALLGAQRPRISSVPDGDDTAGVEAVELAASAGLVLDDWQQFALRSSLKERLRTPVGRARAELGWSAFEVGLVVARQNGKGSILEARELAGLFLFGEQLILHSAHEFKTAQEAFRRVLMLVENTDDLRKRVSRVRSSHGEEGIELIGGQRLRFVARSTGSGRGFTGDCVILDEAYRLPPEAIGALMPTLSARPNPQLWMTSSAGHLDSEVLRRVRERGIAGESERLCYLEWSAPDDADPTDPQAWAQANPALGIRISADHIAVEQDSMPPQEFARERLGIWDDINSGGTVWPLDAWAACRDEASTIPEGNDLTVSVDVSWDRRKTHIAVAGIRADGLRHVQVIASGDGTDWVMKYLQEMRRRPLSIAVQGSGAPASSLLEDLDKSGLPLVTVSGADIAKACGGMHDAVVSGRVRHLGQPDLEQAVTTAVARTIGDAWALDRKKSPTDIAGLVAVVEALWALEALQGRTPSIIDPWEDEPDA